MLTDIGEAGADLIGLGGAEGDEEGKGLIPVVAGLAEIAGRMAGSREAVVGTGLLVLLAVQGGPAERGGEMGASVSELAGGKEHVTQSVERGDFTGLVANLTAHSQGLPLILGGFLRPTQPQVGIAQGNEGLGFTGSAAALAEHGQGLLGEIDRRL